MPPSRKISRVSRRQAELSFDQVLGLLQLNAQDLTKPLIGREPQIKRLQLELSHAVNSPGGPGHLFYLCGQPGTGKSVTMRHVIHVLRRKCQFEFHEINSLALGTVNQLFAEMYRRIFPKSKQLSITECYKKLNEHFRTKRRSQRTHVVIVLDEFDNLTTGSRDRKVLEKLYEVFDWTHQKYANLTVICIANSLALPDTLVPRCGSRLGNGIIPFDTYSWSDLLAMINERVSTAHLNKYIDEQTLQFLCRRVAARSGDARSCFTLLHRLLVEKEEGVVEISAVQSAVTKMFRDGSTRFICDLPTHVKVLLACFILVCDRNTATIQASKLWERYSTELCKIEHLANYGSDLYRESLDLLISARIVRYVVGIQAEISRFIPGALKSTSKTKIVRKHQTHSDAHMPWGQWTIILMLNVADVIQGLKDSEMKQFEGLIGLIENEYVDVF